MSNVQTIVRGDDTFFNGVDTLGAIKLCCELDLTGWKAKFIFLSAVLEFNDLSEKVIQPRFTAQQTSAFPCGEYSATLILYDAEGCRKTQFTNLPYKVVREVIRDGY